MTKHRYYLPIQVRFADTDAQGHVFFGNYLTYFDEALAGYLQAIGFSWQALLKTGLDMFYVDAQCQYKGSATFSEILHVHAKMARIGNTSFTMEFAIYKKETDALITTGSITVVTADIETRKPQRVPDDIRDAVAAYEGQEK